MAKPDLTSLTTEARNPRTERLDALTTLELVAAMHAEDRTVADAVRPELGRIAQGVDAIAERLRKGGRLVHVGAGTSGRLGAVAAASCVPTFSAPPEQVLAVVAGGLASPPDATEGVEDREEQGAADLRALELNHKDAVVGISSSGRTPYVLGALAHARAVKAFTVAVVCNRSSPVAAAVDLPIEVVTGPEVLTGSTRLKAGTATKMVLDMLSTGAFVRRHKVYGNLMVDLQANNEKFVARAQRIVAEVAGCDAATAERLLRECDGEAKTAIVVLRKGITPAQARTLLFHHEGNVRAVLES